MDTKVISHVFGAVNSAERTISRIDALLPSAGAEDIRENLTSQRSIVKRMRRIANILQLEAAKEDWVATTRSLKVFYGLHHMIRKDLLAAQRTLQGEKGALEATPVSPSITADLEAQVLH